MARARAQRRTQPMARAALRTFPLSSTSASKEADGKMRLTRGSCGIVYGLEDGQPIEWLPGKIPIQRAAQQLDKAKVLGRGARARLGGPRAADAQARRVGGARGRAAIGGRIGVLQSTRRVFVCAPTNFTANTLLKVVYGYTAAGHAHRNTSIVTL